MSDRAAARSARAKGAPCLGSAGQVGRLACVRSRGAVRRTQGFIPAARLGPACYRPSTSCGAKPSACTIRAATSTPMSGGPSGPSGARLVWSSSWATVGAGRARLRRGPVEFCCAGDLRDAECRVFVATLVIELAYPLGWYLIAVVVGQVARMLLFFDVAFGARYGQPHRGGDLLDGAAFLEDLDCSAPALDAGGTPPVRGIRRIVCSRLSSLCTTHSDSSWILADGRAIPSVGPDLLSVLRAVCPLVISAITGREGSGRRPGRLT